MKTNKDYQDELKNAYEDLNKPKFLRRKPKKEEDFLNVIIGILVVLIVVVGITGAVLIGKAYVNFDNDDPIVNNDLPNDNQDEDNDVINNNQQDENDVVNNDQNDEIIDETQDDIDNNQDEIVDDSLDDDVMNDQQNEIIDVTNEFGLDFEVVEFVISKEENSVRFDIKTQTKTSGNIFLRNDTTLNIGPISVKGGNNTLYFLINGQSNYSLQFEATDGRIFAYNVNKEDIQLALGE